MISVGVDVSKGKSMVCILKPYGEIVCSPFEVQHSESDLEEMDSLLKKVDGEIRVVMEATGIYHLPILTFLRERGYFDGIKMYTFLNSQKGNILVKRDGYFAHT